jgi:LysM repeat protein
MTEITHTTARALLQADADQALNLTDRSDLDAHLAVCAECDQYAQQFSGLETRLRETLHTRWDKYRPVINLQAIRDPSPLKLFWNGLFQQSQFLGKASVLAALLAGYFVLANVIGIREPLGDDTTPTVLPTPNVSVFISAISPTPSTLATLNQGTPACQTTIYVVKENDTLDKIALQHGTTKELILEYNPDDLSLAANTVFLNMELVIPLCKGTPVHTASLPGNTLTITPVYGTILPEQPE